MLRAALIGLIAFFVIRAMAPHTIGETARRQFLEILRDHYAGFNVSIGRGYVDADVGLIFEDVRIVDRSPSASRFRTREMVRIERLALVADILPERLLDGEKPIKTRRLVLDGVHANAWLDRNNQISLASLFPMPSLGPPIPCIQIRRANVQLHNGAKRSPPIDAEIREALILSSVSRTGEVQRKIQVQGSTDFAAELIAEVVQTAEGTNVDLSIKGARVGRGLFERIPEPWAKLAAPARDLQCLCDVGLALKQTPEGELDYVGRLTVHEGSVLHRLLPTPVTELSGVIEADPEGLTIESAHGRIGDAVVRTSGRVDGYSWPCEVDLNLSTRSLMLDSQLTSMLPQKLQKEFDRLQPRGRIDVDAKVSHQHADWDVVARINCNGVDVRFDKFPYPVEHLRGQIIVRDGIVSAKALSGRIGGSRMLCAFETPMRPNVAHDKRFVTKVESPIAIDKQLLAALTPRGLETSKLEQFVRSLHPSGLVHIVGATLVTDPSGRKSREIDLRIVDGHLRYDKFQYSLDNVSGRIAVEDDLVRVVGFQASNANSGVVQCDGFYRMATKDSPAQASRLANARAAPRRDSELDLSFRAANVPMDKSLRHALPETARQAWDAISPNGILDQLQVSLTQKGARTPVGLEVTATHNTQTPITNRSLSLRPTSLPYRLDVTGGRVRFDGHRVKIESLQGQHDASTLSADGQCIRGKDGRWELTLRLHSGSRIHHDAEWIDSLPTDMREAMRRLQLRGPVSVRGRTRIILPDAYHTDPSMDWDLVLQLEGNRIGDVGPVHAIRGQISVMGVKDERGPRAVGEIWLDSLHTGNLQITGVRGPFSIYGDQLLLGRRAGEEQSGTIRGSLFDGAIELDGQCALSSGNFDVALAVRHAQVPTLLADFGQADNDVTGMVSGRAELRGTLGEYELLKGTGSAQLTGANLYRLPLIVQLLNLLRIRPTEDVAFTEGQVDFTIFGDLVTFSDLQLAGDLVALNGGGTLDRWREIDLTFNSRVSPQNTFSRVIRPLRSQRYTLWTIDVRGPLDDLEIERRAFEGVGETLERLFPQMVSEPTEPRWGLLNNLKR